MCSGWSEPQVKVNSRFEFPHKLNMKPFTKEGRADRVEAPTPKPAADTTGAEGDEAKGPEDDEPATPLHPDEYYEYELMGVVVHTGTCDSGHYYSFIKERDPDYDGVGPDTRQWYEFNDASVTNFDPRRCVCDTASTPCLLASHGGVLRVTWRNHALTWVCGCLACDA